MKEGDIGDGGSSSSLVCGTQIMDEYTMMATESATLKGTAVTEETTSSQEQREDQTWGILRRKGGSHDEFRLEYRHNRDGAKQARYSLGRSRSCDIHIDHKCVSSQHCFIDCDFSQARMRVFLEDNSVNGTFINDALTKIKRGERMELRSGDEIYLINPRPIGTSSSGQGGVKPHSSEGDVASFTFINIRDRIAANREISVAPMTAHFATNTPATAKIATHIINKSLNNGCNSSGSLNDNDTRRIEDLYIIGDKIGSGMSGQVYFCIHRYSKQRCAVKEIDTRKVGLTPGLSIDDMKEEARLLQQLKHVSGLFIKAVCTHFYVFVSCC
jgi:hypothetical protein